MATYILVIYLNRSKKIKIGRLGTISFKRGYYFYVGSGNIARIMRHLRKEKRMKWHIDYLLRKAKVVDFFFSKQDECATARILARHFSSINSFGCSDCRCKSHLYSA